MHLVGISGRARSGKDTVANYLSDQYGFIKTTFAGPVKRAAKEMFGLTDAEMADDVKEQVIEYWGMSPRTMYQKVGTEGGRDLFGEDLWLKRWGKTYREISNKSHVTVVDVRFDNEADLMRTLGGIVIHVSSNRSSPLTATTQLHASEAGVKFNPGTDFRLENNGTFEQLYREIDGIMLYLNGQIAGGSFA